MRATSFVSALCALALGACKQPSTDQAQQPSGGSTAATAPSGSEILIGATLPLTGSEARIGGFYKEGYDLAFEEANQNGGVSVGGKKMQVRLTLLDDTSTQATAASLADRLINSDKVQFLLGTYSSHLVEAQSVVAEQNHVPYVNGGGGAKEIYKRGFKYLFGLLAPVQLLSTALMEWIDSQQQAGKVPKPAKIAVLWENTAHGKDFRAGVSEFVDKRKDGYQVAVDESFELNGKDFSALLGKVKSAGVDLFLADAHLPDYITMQRQYVTPGLTKKFVDTFKTKHKKDPEWYQAMGYETARALFLALEKAGTLDRDNVRDALAALDVESIVPGGKLQFKQENGQQAIYPFVVQQNQPDGSSPIVWPKESAKNSGSPAARPEAFSPCCCSSASGWCFAMPHICSSPATTRPFALRTRRERFRSPARFSR